MINTHSVSLHSWESRGSGESASTLHFKTNSILLFFPIPVTRQMSVWIVLCYMCHSPSIVEGFVPEGREHLYLRAYQVYHCYPVNQQNRFYHLEVEQKVIRTSAQKNLKCARTSSPALPGGPGGPRAPTGPLGNKSKALRSWLSR